MSPMASQITSFTIVNSTVYSVADQRKHQSSASLALVRGIHRSPHKGPVTRKMSQDLALKKLLAEWQRVVFHLFSWVHLNPNMNGTDLVMMIRVIHDKPCIDLYNIWSFFQNLVLQISTNTLTKLLNLHQYRSLYYRKYTTQTFRTLFLAQMTNVCIWTFINHFENHQRIFYKFNIHVPEAPLNTLQILCRFSDFIPDKLPRIFPGAPFTFNGNIQGNLDRYATLNNIIITWR